MFCGECGTKNKNGALFCENCGAKIEGGKNVVVKEKKPLTKKSKLIIAIVSVVAVILIGLCIFLGSLTNPKNIAEKVFNAVVGYDFETIYEYLNVEDSEFTSKEMFVKVMTNDLEEENKPVVLNYTVGNPVDALDKLSTTVTITYMLQDAEESEALDIKLVKDKTKKWLLFDNWKVNIKDVNVAKNYEVKVLKGSTVVVEGVQLPSSYIDSEESSDEYDVYVIPSIFEAKYNVTITLPMGIQVNDKMSVVNDSYYKYSLSVDDLTEENKNALIIASKTSLQAIYDGVKEQKTFDDIKSTFEYENSDLASLKKDYENLVRDVGTSIQLTSIAFTEVTLSSASITSDNDLKLYVKAKFDYSISYQSGEETKTNDDNDYDYMYLTFKYVNGQYKLIDTSSLNTYFSKY